MEPVYKTPDSRAKIEAISLRLPTRECEELFVEIVEATDVEARLERHHRLTKLIRLINEIRREIRTH